jgi:hypothetical protein
MPGVRQGADAPSVVCACVCVGVFPIPFKLQCNLCGATCSFKIPILSKEVSIPLPPCPM